MTVSGTAANLDADGEIAAASNTPSAVQLKKRVVFIGTTGVGKSALASLILGLPAFATSEGMRRRTKPAQIEENDKYVFVDTQGLLDPDDSQVIVRSNIIEGLKKLGKVDVIVLVLRVGIYCSNLHEAHTFLMKNVLGEEAYNNMMVVFTCSLPKCVRDENEAQRYIKEEYLTHPPFRELYHKINGRVIFVSIPPVSDEPEEERVFEKYRALSLEHITKAIDQMNAPPIMNEDLRKAQDRYDEEQKRIAEEKRRLQAEKEAAIFAKGREAAENEFAAKFKALEDRWAEYYPRESRLEKISIPELHKRTAEEGGCALS